MPRPQRCRRICGMPQVNSFYPEGCRDIDPIFMTLDEYEVIRLVDLEQRTHEQCAAQMDISRSTVQEICESARYKLAACLVHGHRLVIDGGHYRVCGGREERCCGMCRREERTDEVQNDDEAIKGGNIMIIAVTYENGQIFQHFGHTAKFKIYTIADGKVQSSEVVDTNGSGHGALTGFLMSHGVNTLICGGIGGGAQAALAMAGIKLYGGASGSADNAVHALLDGKLLYNPNVMCNHHSHGEGKHNCADHKCIDHKCDSHSCH